LQRELFLSSPAEISADESRIQRFTGSKPMTRTFTQRVQTAASAGWCVIIIAIIWLTLMWFGNLAMQYFRPGWILTLWGGNVTWDQVNWIILMFTAVIKVILFTLVAITLWLTIWGRKLSRVGVS